MNKQSTWLVLFIAASLVQLGVPASMIMKRERALEKGEVFKFKTMPVDPYDAFRGRYVALGFEQNSVTNQVVEGFRRGQRVFAELKTGPDGFSRVTGLTHERPDDVPYMQVRVQWHSAQQIRFRMPFDRYYLEEDMAPEAERAYREHSRAGRQDAYVTVRVRSGFAVLEDLYVADIPIHEFLKERREQGTSQQRNN